MFRPLDPTEEGEMFNYLIEGRSSTEVAKIAREIYDRLGDKFKVLVFEESGRTNSADESNYTAIDIVNSGSKLLITSKEDDSECIYEIEGFVKESSYWGLKSYPKELNQNLYVVFNLTSSYDHYHKITAGEFLFKIFKRLYFSILLLFTENDRKEIEKINTQDHCETSFAYFFIDNKTKGRDSYYEIEFSHKRSDPCPLCNKESNENCKIEYSEKITIEDIFSGIDGGLPKLKIIFKNPKLVNLEILKNIPTSDLTIYDEGGKYDYKSDEITLEDCLNSFGSDEKLQGNNQYKGENGKSKQDHLKTLSLFTLPEYLIICLKRFEKVDHDMRPEKIKTKVDFPLENLDLSKYLKDAPYTPLLYDLYGVINHTGNSEGGHYTATGKNIFDNTWRCFNDSSVYEVNPFYDIVTSEAYVLFYKRKSSQFDANDHENHDQEMEEEKLQYFQV